MATQDGQKRRRSKKSIRTEKDILQHASILFAEMGYDDTTTREIATAAGISEGTIFTYFPTKLDLLAGIMDEYYVELLARCEEIMLEEISAYKRLQTLMRLHLFMAKTKWRIGRVVAKEGRFGNDTAFIRRFYDHNKRYSKYFLTTIDALKAEGYIRSTVSTTLIRDALFGVFEHVTVRYYIAERDFDLDIYVDQIMDIVLFGCAKGITLE